MMMTIGLSALLPYLIKWIKHVIPNPPSQQAVVGGKQLQQPPAPAGQGVGTLKQKMNPGQYVSLQHDLNLYAI